MTEEVKGPQYIRPPVPSFDNPFVVQNVQAPTTNNGNNFDENKARYGCCCGLVHARTGALILAYLEILVNVANIAAQFLLKGPRAYYGGGQYVNVAVSLITILISLLLIYGINSTKPNLLIPHLVYDIIGLLLIGVSIGLIGWQLAQTIDYSAKSASTTPHYYEERFGNSTMNKGITIIILICLVAASAIKIWYFAVIMSAFRYLWDKQESQRSATRWNYGARYGGKI